MFLSLYTLICCVLFNATTGQKVTFKNLTTDITDNIFLLFMNSSTVDDYVTIKLEDGLTLPSCVGFEAQRETIFHFHGWREDPATQDASTVTLGTAFLQRNGSNVVFFDYSSLVKSNHYLGYPEAFVNTSHIGGAIGQYFQQYIPTVQLIQNIHFTSFSIGSQVMSITARTYGAGELPWLTALDPAGPIYNLPTVDHLTSSDGVFVDVIHTDGGFFGDFRSVGTVDIFANRGTRVQPACKSLSANVGCSHSMSYQYYAASMSNPTAFPGKECNRNALGIPHSCSTRNEYTYIGYRVNKTAQGNFYLDTGATFPYGLGMGGIDDYSF